MTSGRSLSLVGAPQPLRIAQVAPLYESVPPTLYGGTERIVAHLTNALVDLGHDVTLFASGDADTKAELVPVRDEPIRLAKAPLKSDLASHLSMLHEVHRRRADFDIIHFHEFNGYGFYTNISVPVDLPGCTALSRTLHASALVDDQSCGFILWIEAGRIDCLEGYPLGGDAWPHAETFRDIILNKA